MLPIAFKLITYGTARVKTSEHVNLCISLYTKNCLYHNFLPILAKYFPNCFQISMSTRCLIQWLCEDISVGGGCLRQGYFAYSCLIRVLRVSSPIWQGAILHNHIYVTTLQSDWSMPAQFHINYMSVTDTIYIHYLYLYITSLYIIYIFIHSSLYSGVWACKLFYPVTYTCFDSF